MDAVTRLRAADEFMRRLAGALRGAQLYAPTHPLVQRAFDGLHESITQLLVDQPSHLLRACRLPRASCS